jgi:purine-nucleoside phosphorylase
MSIHIDAKPGDIAETILLPGDPLRAKFIAENFLKDVSCYNQTRGMLGFTGEYEGMRISVQGTGMGLPSLSIYVNELLKEYGVKTLIRVGTCGSFQENVKVRDIVLAMSAATDSGINRNAFQGLDYPPTADFHLLKTAHSIAEDRKLPTHVGPILSSDCFYQNNPELWKMWASYGVLATEMESTALYTLAAKHQAKALSILTVSDTFLSKVTTSAEEREKSFTHMMDLALTVCLKSKES